MANINAFILFIYIVFLQGISAEDNPKNIIVIEENLEIEKNIQIFKMKILN